MRTGSAPESSPRRGKVRYLFSGGNTARGFYSYYDFLPRPLPSPWPARMWIIKGGPGVGKSTFMRAIADDLIQRGYDVELHRCSADNESIDGVVVPALGAALVDGTAPHVIDPAYPGAVDEIVNFGDYWDSAAVRRHRRTIIDITARYKECYASAYRFLAAAGAIHEDWRSANATTVDFGAVDRVTWELIDEFVRQGRPGRRGYVRKLFGSAITPDGPRNDLAGLAAEARRRIVITGEPGTGKSTIVAKLAAALSDHGYDLELFHCSLRPEDPEHVVVPALGLAVITSEEPHVWQGHAERVIDLNAMRDQGAVVREARRREEAQAVFWDLLQRGIDWLSRAKAIHDEMEACYAPYMDFGAIEVRRRQIVEQIASAAPAT